MAPVSPAPPAERPHQLSSLSEAQSDEFEQVRFDRKSIGATTNVAQQQAMTEIDLRVDDERAGLPVTCVEGVDLIELEVDDGRFIGHPGEMSDAHLVARATKEPHIAVDELRHTVGLAGETSA